MVCWIFSFRLKKIFDPQNYDAKIDLRYNGRVTIGFVFVSAFQNICYLSQKKVSSLRNVSFSYDKENPIVKFMRFSIGINLDWTNINMKAIKGAYDSQNSFLAFKQVIKVFNSTLFSQSSICYLPAVFIGIYLQPLSAS